MSWDIGQAPSQKDRCVIVTGANVGTGFETALALAGKGADIILACRNSQRAAAAKASIHQEYSNANIVCMELELSRLTSVRQFADDFNKNYAKLDILINNAGVMMSPYEVTEDGFEYQLATNYIGHFALTGLLLPLMEQTPNARVVSVSSVAHKLVGINLDDLHFKHGYNKRSAYGQSKLACLMFAYELQRRLASADYRTISVAAHPGVSLTNLLRHLPWIVKPIAAIFAQSAAAGALPILYAALGDDIKGGDYCGPESKKEWRGRPVKVDSNKRSKDEHVAAALWQATEQMTGVHYFA